MVSQPNEEKRGLKEGKGRKQRGFLRGCAVEMHDTAEREISKASGYACGLWVLAGALAYSSQLE